MPVPRPTSVPLGRTARRVEWAHLPPRLRSAIEAEVGSPVATAVSQTSGFTPSLASVLTCADGTQHFVKAASLKAQRPFAAALRAEADNLAELPPTVPATRLRWTVETDDWFALGLDHVPSRLPHRPWTGSDLDAALDALEVVADQLTPPPPGLALSSLADDLAGFLADWEHVVATRPDLARAADAQALASSYVEVVAGDTVVHTDVRDDNLLVRPDGTAVLCDWNWPTRGARWVDTLLLMVGPRGDGLDVDAVLASRRLTRDVPAQSIDVVLALVTGYFLRQGDLPVPPSSPHLRDFQRWQGEVCWDWLVERRGW